MVAIVRDTYVSHDVLKLLYQVKSEVGACCMTIMN